MQIFNLLGIIVYPLSLLAMLIFIWNFTESFAFQFRHRVVSITFLVRGIMVGAFAFLCFVGTYRRYTNLLANDIGDWTDRAWIIAWTVLTITLLTEAIIYRAKWNNFVFDFRRKDDRHADS